MEQVEPDEAPQVFQPSPRLKFILQKNKQAIKKQLWIL